MCVVCLDLCAGHRYICLSTLFGFDRRSVGVFVLFKLEICQEFHCLSRWGHAGVLALVILGFGLGSLCLSGCGSKGNLCAGQSGSQPGDSGMANLNVCLGSPCSSDWESARSLWAGKDECKSDISVPDQV